MKHNSKLSDLSIGENPNTNVTMVFTTKLLRKRFLESYKTKYASAILVNPFGKPTWPQNIRVRNKQMLLSMWCILALKCLSHRFP